MTLQSSGEISLNDVKGEFGGSAPDGIEEYYRGGGLVTDNNTNIPTCETADCPINLEEFYDGQLVYSKSVSIDTPNLVMSTLFNETEWTSSVPKEVVIETGVAVYSASTSSVACNTGTLVNGQAMGGTLRLVVNGYIYGAGGAAGTVTSGGTGGTALRAEIDLSVLNNSRIWAGGGGGGKGGQGAYVRYYPETTAWKFNAGTCPNSLLTTNSYFWNRHYATDVGMYIAWGQSPGDPRMEIYSDGLDGYNASLLSDGDVHDSYYYGCDGVFHGSPGPIDTCGYRYERGAFVFQCAYDDDMHRIRRSLMGIIAGGAGGNGGHGKGFVDVRTDGNIGSIITNGARGGTGGDGGDWGENGGDGANGNGGNPTYHVETTGEAGGYVWGAAGLYISGNSRVTWESGTGTELGRVGA